MLPRDAEIGICSPAAGIAIALSIMLLSLLWWASDSNAAETGVYDLAMAASHHDDGAGGGPDGPCPQPAGSYCGTAVDLMASASASRAFARKAAAMAPPSYNPLYSLMTVPPRRPPRTAA